MDSSFSSSPSSENVLRSSILRQQREAALRRRQSLAPPRRDSHCGVESSRPSSRRMSLGAINAIADVIAWEEAKTKERIEARIRKDEDTKAGALSEHLDAQKQSDLKGRQEAMGGAEVASKREDDVQKLAEANAAAQQRENERVADLERRLAEAERAKFQAEKLTERALMFTDRHNMIASILVSGTNIGACSDADICQSTKHPNSSHRIRSSVGVTTSQINEPTPTVLDHMDSRTSEFNEAARGHVPTTGRNSGYERYLATFHQPSKVTDGSTMRETSVEDVSKISESRDGLIIHESTPTIVEPPTLSPTPKITGVSESKISGNDADQINRNHDKKSESLAYDGHSRKKDSVIKGSSPQSISSIDAINLDHPKVMRCFLMKPCSKGEGIVQCCVRRNKGLFPEYRMYLNRSNSKTETFLLSSKKRVGNKSSNYLISMSRNDHDKNSDGILGKLRSNFLGTEYQLYDHGKNPEYDDTYNEENNNGEIRIELGAILYANNTSLGSKGPRKMNMCINKVDDDGNSLKIWQPKTKDDERMMTCFKKQTSSADKLVCLESQPPKWNNDVGAHVLYFNSKATLASVKNFQLCTQNDEHHVIMQFGRIDKDEFSLEVQWPMSLFQAFAVALSSFDSKLGCD